MVLRALLSFFVRNDQLVQRLADSYPMRRAAQLTAYVFFRGKQIGEESIEKLKESDAVHKFRNDAEQTGQRLGAFKNVFSQEVKDGFKKITDDIKKQQR